MDDTLNSHFLSDVRADGFRVGLLGRLYRPSDGLFCPYCGQRDVWVERGEGDYYHGPEHVCVPCNTRFSLP